MSASLWKGTIAGGLLLFVWYAVANALPGHQAPILAFHDDGAVVASLLQQHAEPGTYFLNRIPGKLGVGPGYWGWLTVHRSQDYAVLHSVLGSLVSQLVVAFCLSWVLQRTSVRGFARRWGFVVILGVAATVAGPLTYWNWSWFSSGYAATQVFDVLVGWALAGALLAKLVPHTNDSMSGST